jgi:methylmalonyl-CoA mutase N-terminal domain/subunit
VALRTQQIIASETGVTKAVDPMAGSYYLEALTDTIEEQVWKYLKRIDRMGGAMAAIEKGYFQEEIRNNAYRLKKEIDGNSRIIVGVNKFQDAHDVEPALNRIDPEREKKQLTRLAEFKAGRDMTKVSAMLGTLQESAEKEENLMPHIINCVKSYTTLGEISDTLRDVFGRYEPKISF